MFTNKDVEYRSIFVVNCIDNKALRVSNGGLLFEDTSEKKTLTKLPFQKILVLFVIGHISITTAFIEKCSKYGIPVVIMKPNLRPIFFYSITAEANFLLRKKQYEYEKSNLKIPKILVENKIKNQIRLLEKTRITSGHIRSSMNLCNDLLLLLPQADSYEEVLGIEGKVANAFFTAYFEPFDWHTRCPRAKTDVINSTLDIGYTILFNFIEAFTRLFGFDPYRGVYHQLWFKRKSLVCDLVEPFRCLIDGRVRKAFNLKQCKKDDFNLIKNEYVLKREKNSDYTKMFFEILIEQKNDIFRYMQQYYRCFMQDKRAEEYQQCLI